LVRGYSSLRRGGDHFRELRSGVDKRGHLPNISKRISACCICGNLLPAGRKCTCDMLDHVIAVHLRVGIPNTFLRQQVSGQGPTRIIRAESIGIQINCI
jgi:hypothetical protein